MTPQSYLLKMQLGDFYMEIDFKSAENQDFMKKMVDFLVKKTTEQKEKAKP